MLVHVAGVCGVVVSWPGSVGLAVLTAGAALEDGWMNASMVGGDVRAGGYVRRGVRAEWRAVLGDVSWAGVTVERGRWRISVLDAVRPRPVKAEGVPQSSHDG